MSDSIAKFVEQTVGTQVFGIWFLIGAALVFFMQAGFAMVETGFTRAKNAGNIIMKNLMDFCIGTVMFVFLGFSLMMAENYLFGFIGVPNLTIFTDFGSFVKTNASSFVFNLVFCATAATIVSGSMAERTKFLSYCIYSGVISLIVYPIEAGWVWNSQGWLVNLGFHDFAGSAAIHSVGGLTALIGAGSRRQGHQGQRHPRPFHHPGRPGLLRFVVRLVRLQRRRRLGQRLPGLHLPDHHHRPGRGHRRDHALHLDQERQARRIHVPERLPGGPGGHHRRLRRPGRPRRHRCGRRERHPGGRRGGAAGSALPCGRSRGRGGRAPGQRRLGHRRGGPAGQSRGPGGA